MKLPGGIIEYYLMMTVHCPDCGNPMYFDSWETETGRLKTIHCTNESCSEFNRRWKLDMDNGLAKRMD